MTLKLSLRMVLVLNYLSDMVMTTNFSFRESMLLIELS